MKCRGGKKKGTRRQMEQKDCRGKEGLPGLQTDLLLLLLRFIHTEGVRRPGTDDQLCVNHFFSSPLHSQLYGNKAQKRSGDLRLCISSGSRPVGVQFPSLT